MLGHNGCWRKLIPFYIVIAIFTLLFSAQNEIIAGKSRKRIEHNVCYVVKRTAVVTAYTAGKESTGKGVGHALFGITASGTKVKEWHTIAMDRSVPFDTKVYIPHFGDSPNAGVFTVEDRGNAIRLNRHPIGVHKVDVYMQSIYEARKFGRRTLDIYIILGRKKMDNGTTPRFPEDFELMQGVAISDSDVNTMLETLDNTVKKLDMQCGTATSGDATIIKLDDLYYVVKDGKLYVSEWDGEQWV